MFPSSARTFRQPDIASVAFRFLGDIPVPSPHLHAALFKRRAGQCFPADDTLEFGVLVGGTASLDAICFAQYAGLCTSSRLLLYSTLLYSEGHLIL